MVGNVEIISKEMITPSSKTPNHLMNHKLSFLDQLAPSFHIPLIFFYKPETKNILNNTTNQISQLLKQSLSNTLTQFYPLAGWINGTSSIDCTDEGVEYIEARVHAHVDQVTGYPTMADLEKYFAKQQHSNTEYDAPLLSIQVNFFDCGGIAIGVCISHKVADGLSLATFMNAWSVICRADEDKVQKPMFNSGELYFPAKDMSGFSSPVSNIGISQEKIKTERLVFSKETLETLKQAIKDFDSGSYLYNPTRVEAVSAFIWKNIIKGAMNSKKMFAAVHAVNLRTRMTPPLPENAFGNVWRHTLAVFTPESEKDDHNYAILAGKLRKAISSMNNEYIQKLQKGDEYLNSLKEHIKLFFSEDIEFSNFSSWCRFPVYEVDFGWGKPVWVSTMTLPFKNLVIFMSSRCGEEIEAWVNMAEDDMSNLQKEMELLSLPAKNF